MAKLLLGKEVTDALNADLQVRTAALREKGINLFLTGITWPEIPWVARNHAAAKEHGVTLVGGTHYSTEKFAPMEMVKFFEGLGLACEFIPETPRLQEL